MRLHGQHLYGKTILKKLWHHTFRIPESMMPYQVAVLFPVIYAFQKHSWKISKISLCVIRL